VVDSIGHVSAPPLPVVWVPKPCRTLVGLMVRAARNDGQQAEGQFQVAGIVEGSALVAIFRDGSHEFLASGREKTMATDDAEVRGHSSCFGT
jgi:hypothetical protein